jgi:Glycosyltransferase family 87
MNMDLPVHPEQVTKALSFLTCIAVLLQARVRPLLVWSIAVVVVLLFIGHLVIVFPAKEFGFDYRIFWKVGRDVWAGQNPYAAEPFREHPFLQPPSALPVFALFAVLPFGLSCALWTAANVALCLLLPAYAQRTLNSQDDASVGRIGKPSYAPNTQRTVKSQDDASVGRIGKIGKPSYAPWPLPLTALAALTAALAVSDASLTALYTGQVSILATVFLLAALHAQARGRPLLAGVWLALATIKVGTMVPFLLLFLRKSDRAAWVSLGAVVLGLCLVTGHVSELPDRLASWLHHIDELALPGQVNDYSFQGTQHETIVGLDHALYRLGLRDRSVIRIIQGLVLILLGCWVAREVLPPGRLPRVAACSLVALYAALFLYHRIYDMVILVLPLVYSAARAQATTGWSRRLFLTCALAILLVLYLSKGLLRAILGHSFHCSDLGPFVQAAFLPAATWLILLAMFCLVAAERSATLDRSES